MPFLKQQGRMEEKFNGVSFDEAVPGAGITLLELLVTAVICSIFIGLFSTQYPVLQRTSYRFLEQSNFEEQYLIFMVKLEENYQMNALTEAQDLILLEQMTFKIDHDWDGDYDQVGDRLAYRWNPQEQRLEQRKGNGAFNGILNGVASFSWAATSSSPLCYRIDLKSIYNSRLRSSVLCRTVPLF